MSVVHSGNDRFAVSFLAALGLHAMVLLGVGFVLDFKPLTHPLETLDVVLVNWKSETKPDEADFLAQASQQGGGESDEASKPSQENTGASPGPAEGEDPMDQQEQVSTVTDAAREQVLVEDQNSEFSQQITSIEQPEPPLPSAAELMQESMIMAKLAPGIQRDRDSQSKLPRRKWISANTREYEFAAYMQAWVAKVERVGNLNYPEEVRRLKLIGDLVMTVGINIDGSVESIDIRRSSGKPQLDQAATRIVRLAGPYSPLPEHIRESVDVLHITRTWRFSRDFKGLN
ncbi:MAG: TonB family protein [Gammaproteobacteria bacterium]|nr:TonB family protein [Gammaproteobacteria bacterium]NNL00192.1 TonB family protein [Xanthomonadales bacterium]